MKQEQFKTVPDSSEITAAELVTQLVRLKLESWLNYLKDNEIDNLIDTTEVWEEQSSSQIQELEQRLYSQTNSPRNVLIDVFGLSDAEIAMLDTCVAIAADSSLEDLVVQLQGRPYRPQVTENLLKRLFKLSPKPIWQAASPLSRWKMIEPIEDPSGFCMTFKADPVIVNWYFGFAALDEAIIEACSLKNISEDCFIDSVSQDSQRITKLLSLGHSIRVTIQGNAGTGRKDFSASLCNQLGKRALYISSESLAETSFSESYIRIQRYCILTNRIPVWLTNTHQWPKNIDACPLQIVVCEPQQLPADHNKYHDYVIAQPQLNLAQKQQIWQISQATPLPGELHACNYDEIKFAASVAHLGVSDLKQVLSNQRELSALKELGQVVQPIISWSDLVLSDSITHQLKLFTKEIQLRETLLSNSEAKRLYKRDTNSSALFAGPPGVGKTMAAQCVASDLGLPLVIIDVGKTINKYIGETAKNLSKIFEQAEKHRCLLFFDEADAFFSQRTDLNDSHDRYANADTNHLLQLVENYAGPLILATNQKARIDAAFFRRIRNIVTFTHPDRTQRLQLWLKLSNLLFSNQEIEALSETFERYATKFELSPAQIKSSVLNAKYLSLIDESPLCEQFIMQGIARELQKDGRSIPQSLKNNLEEPSHVN